MVIGFGLFANDDLNIPVSNFRVNTQRYIFYLLVWQLIAFNWNLFISLMRDMLRKTTERA